MLVDFLLEQVRINVKIFDHHLVLWLTVIIIKPRLTVLMNSVFYITWWSKIFHMYFEMFTFDCCFSRNYSNSVRPVRNASQPVPVKLGLTLTQIFDMVGVEFSWGKRSPSFDLDWKKSDLDYKCMARSRMGGWISPMGSEWIQWHSSSKSSIKTHLVTWYRSL